VAVAESIEISLRDSNCLDKYVHVTGKLVKEEPGGFILIAREVADATTNENCL
jgi:hypothetical protein